MYDQIFSKSFSKYEQKKIRHFSFFACVAIALSICTIFKPQFDVQSVCDTKKRLQSSSFEPLNSYKIVDDQTYDGERRKKEVSSTKTSIKLQLSNSTIQPDEDIVEDAFISKPVSSSTSSAIENTSTIDAVVFEPSANLQLSTGASQQEMTVVNVTIISKPAGAHFEDKAIVNTTVSKPSGVKSKGIKPKLVCSFTEPISDYCEITGDVRVHPNSSTIFVSSNQIGNYSAENDSSSWVIKPYAGKGNEGAMASVKQWTIKLVPNHENSPCCTQNHRSPAILFSTSGYSGNHFHDFSDIIIPLFSTSRKFDGEVHFLATNYQSWWVTKFLGILDKLSNYKVVDIDKEDGTRCYTTTIVGLKTRKELGIDTRQSQYSMKDFIQFLRSTYSLGRKTAIKMKNKGSEKPRLMIISRRKSRVLLNEGKVAKMAQSLGYEVVAADATLSTNLSKFAELVNSCDVLMGVHGAGLTNMLFLPDNGVVIQVVPLGIDEPAMHDFGEPSVDMAVRYLGYKIRVRESTLINKYSLNDAVIRDPLSLHKKGWDVIRSVYLDDQNVKVDVRRFRGTLFKALKLLYR